MAKAPAYQHYAKDWLAGTAHLTLEQQGAYQRLLDHQWEDGPLPDDARELGRRLGVTPSVFRRIWAALERHFPLTPDGRRANPRLEVVRKEAADFKANLSESGKRGAERRWGQRRNDGVANGEANGVAYGETMPLQPASSSASSEKDLTTLADSAGAYPVGCVVAVNRALEAKLGGVYKPLVATSEAGQAGMWEALGVPLDLAQRVLTERVRGFKVAPHSRQPNSLKYFDNAVRAAWERERAKVTPIAGKAATTIRRITA